MESYRFVHNKNLQHRFGILCTCSFLVGRQRVWDPMSSERFQCQDVGQITACRRGPDPEGLRDLLRGQVGILFVLSSDDGRQTFVRGPAGFWDFWEVCSPPSRLANSEASCESTECMRAEIFLRVPHNVGRFDVFIKKELNDRALFDSHWFVIFCRMGPTNPA
jgi:hypothetical protein